MPAFVRLDLWNRLQCEPGAQRLGFLGRIAKTEAPAVFSVASDESFTVTLPADRCVALGVATGMAIAVIFSDGTFDEWRVSQIVQTRPTWAITCTSVLIDLVDDLVFVDATVSGFPTFASGMASTTATEAVDAIIADRAAQSAGIPLFVGDIASTAILPSIQWDTAGTVARLRAVQQAVLGTGQPCEVRLRRNGTAGYFVDLPEEVGGSAAVLFLRIAKHLQGDTQVTRQRQDQATVVIVRGGDLAGFPTGIGLARWVVTNVASNVVTLADPAGGAGPIGADGQFEDGGLYREADGTLLEITDSSAANQTVTLSSAGSLANGDIVQLRTTSDPSTAKPIVELPYPSRITTYGRKVNTFQRSSVIGVPNMAPNAVGRLWSVTTALPDGYTWATRNAIVLDGGLPFLAPGTNTPGPIAGGGLVDISQNTDPLFTQLGSTSLHVRALSGLLVTPPLKLVPWYAGMPLSLRFRFMPVSGFDSVTSPNSIMRVWLGIARADGSIAQWFDPSRIEQFKPAGSTARPSPPYQELTPGVWNDIELDASDITAASALGPIFMAVTDDIIASLATDALGIVAVLEFLAQGTVLFGGGTSFLPIEGYFAGAFLAPASKTPDGMSEFGGSNTLHQTGNLVLGEVSRESIEIVATVFDLERANPTANAADKLNIGAKVQLVDPVAPNEPFRMSQYTPDYLTPKKAQATFASLRRVLTDLLVNASDGSVQLGGSTSAGALGSTASGTGATGGGTAGGSLPSVTVTLSLDGSLVPTFAASVSSTVTKIFYAWSTSAPPTIADILAGTEIDAPSDFSATHAAISAGDSIYIGVIAKDAVGNASVPAYAQSAVPTPEPGTLNPAIPLLNIGTNAGPWQAQARYDLDNSMDYVRGGSTRNGGDCWRTQINTSAAYTLATQVKDFSKTIFIDLQSKTIPGDGMLVLQLMDNVSFTPSLYFWLDSSRILHAGRSDTGSDVALGGCDAASAIPATGGGWLELIGKIDGSAGAAIAYYTPLGGARVKLFDQRTLNTVSDANSTGTGIGAVVLGPSAWTNTVGNSNGPALVLISDEHGFDRTGVSLDDVSGRCCVATTFPNGAGHYTDVVGTFDDFAGEDQEGDYVAAEFTANDQRLSFTLTALDANVGQVNAAAPFYATRESDSSDTGPIGRTAIRSGSTDAESADVPVPDFTVAGGHYCGFNVDASSDDLNPRFAQLVDPNTSAAWTLTGWAAAEVVWRQRVASSGALLCQLGVDVSCYPAALTNGPGPAVGSRVIPYRVIMGASLDSAGTLGNEVYQRLHSALTIPATCATTTNLPANSYSNGSSGVGATLTATSTGTLTVDGHLVALNDYVLVNNESNPDHNGLYKCTTAGAVGVAYVLTRAVEMDTGGEFPLRCVHVASGTTNANTKWIENNSVAVTVGSDALGFVAISTTFATGVGNLLGSGGGTDGSRHGALRSANGDVDIQIDLRSAQHGDSTSHGVGHDDFSLLPPPAFGFLSWEVYEAVWCDLNSSSIATELGLLRVLSAVAGAEQVRLSLNSSRQFVATRRDSTPHTLQTSTATAPSSGRFGIAWRVRINPQDSTGADSYLKVWLTTSGTRTLIIDTEGTSQPLRANGFGNTCGAVGFFGVYGSSTDGALATFSDPVVANPGTTSSSTAMANGRWGNLLPNGAGTFNDSTAHDYTKVIDSDNSNFDTIDGDYNVFTAANKKDTYALASVAGDASSILAAYVYAFVCLPKTAGGSGHIEKFRPLMIMNGSLLRGPIYNIGSQWPFGHSMLASRFVMNKNRVTGVALSPSDLNSAEAGGEVLTHANEDTWLRQVGVDYFYEWSI
jgi:hypothetical protein